MMRFSTPLAALALVALFIGLICAAQAQTAPQPATKAAIACLVGLAPVGCDVDLRDTLKTCGPNMDTTRCHQFTITRAALINTIRCSSPDGSLGNECPLGELESVTYLGTQKSGYDVYDVKYRNNEETYVLSAEPDGQIHFERFTKPPRWVMPSSLVAITAAGGQVLFSRRG